jgi:putative hydrolase of the HAD superfamily
VGATIPANVRAVFFDAVGTLLVPEPPAVEIYRAVAARGGLALSSDEVGRRFLIAYWAEEEADRLAGWVTNEQRESERWRRIVGSTLAGIRDPETCFRELFEHFALPAAWRVDPDIGPVVAALRNRDLVLGIGSNYDARLGSVLKGFPQLAALRDRVVISAAVGYRKPAQAFFQEVIRLAAREPGEILFVGDHFDNDYTGARSAGLQAALLDPTGNDARAGFRISRLRRLLD